MDSVATFLEPTLKAWNIPYSILTDDKEVEQISIAMLKAFNTSMPTAVLLVGETT